MTLNNLDEHLSWLLSNAGVSRSNLFAQHANPTGTTATNPADGVQPRGQTISFGQGIEMARESELQRRKVPSVVARQRQLLTPASTTPSGRFEQTYSQFVKNSPSSVRSTRQHESPLSRAGQGRQAAPLPTPEFPSIDEDDEVMEITADEACGSSEPVDFGTNVKLRNGECAARPVPPRTRAKKKRKSDEMSKAWGADDEDEFPDLQELLSTPVAPRASARRTPDIVAARSNLRRATAEPSVTSSARSSGPKSPSPSGQNRTLSPAKPPRSPSRVESRPPTQPLRTPEGSPRKLPPVVLKPNALSPDTIERALARTPRPKKARRSSVIEETDEEFVTPSTGGGDRPRSAAGIAGLNGPITAIPCTFEISMPKLEPSPVPAATSSAPARSPAKDKAPSSSTSATNQIRISPRKSQASSSPLADLGGLENLVEKPWPLHRRLDNLREELDQNRRAFEGALRESWPREKRDEIRKDKERLSSQQQLLKGLLERIEAYHLLKKDVEALLKHISDAYVDGRSTDEDEDKLDQIQDEVKLLKQAFVEALSEAASQNPKMVEQLKAIPPQTTGRIPQTQPPMTPSLQNTPRPTTYEPWSSGVVHQTQFPDEPPRHYQPVPGGEPPPIDPDDLDGMFSDLDESPAHRRTPAQQLRAHPNPSEPFRNQEHEYFSDDFDPDMFDLADSFATPGPSALDGNRRRSPLSITSGNLNPPPRRKGPEKRVASTATRHAFPPEQMKFPWSPEVKQMLKDRFRMEHFRHNQLEAINATLSGKDAFILMPTGGGKSLCYQLPAVIKSGSTKGITIVISPLISLMQDQVDHLKALNIHAVAYNGEASREYKEMVMKMFKETNPENFIELLYVTPEMMSQNKRFQDAMASLYQKRKLARIVIDEAHCVSQWGHDFRPDYKQVGVVRQQFRGVPLMALTATATENVIVDVMHNLGMVNSQVFTQSFNRPNLYYEVRVKSGNVSALESIADLIQTNHPDQCGIVYTISRKSAESVASKLREAGIKAAHYHASVEVAEKAKTQRQWQANKIRVVVATIAFGMGIDKPDVRFVIHHGIPKSLEGYYQETGRAGRDGKPSDCYLYFSLADVRILRKLIQGSEGPWEQKQRQIGMLNRMVSYCDNPSDCRRVEVLRYFGEDFDKADCKKSCDNCRSGAQAEQRDYTAIAKAILEAVARERPMTAGQCADILLGKRAMSSDDLNEPKVEYHAVATDLKKYDIERIINKLSMEGALGEENKINNKAGYAIQYLALGVKVNTFRYGRKRLTLPVQVSKGSKEPSAPKPRKRAKKDDASKPPASTEISSPVAPMSRKKTASRAAAANLNHGDPSAFTRNGYGRDDFVVDDDTDDEHFEPISKKRKSNQGKAAESLGPPILEDKRLESLLEIHQEVVQAFVGEAKKLEESIRNSAGLRRPLFSEQNFQDMAIHWTTTAAEMGAIRGVDAARVEKHGARFVKLVRKFYEEYTEMMGIAGDDGDDKDVVDLVSSDEDFDFDLEPDGGGGGPGEESKFFSAPERPPARGGLAAVQDWHQQLLLASAGSGSGSGSRNAGESGTRGAKRGSRGGGGRRGGKKWGGVQKRSASGGSGSRGSRNSGSSADFKGRKGGGGGKGGGKGGGSFVGLMPLV